MDETPPPAPELARQIAVTREMLDALRRRRRLDRRLERMAQRVPPTAGLPMADEVDPPTAGPPDDVNQLHSDSE